MDNNLLGFSFFSGNYQSLIKEIDNYLRKNQSCFIITPTTEILYASYKDSYLSGILKSADILLPDSITLVKLAKVFRKGFTKRVTGIDTIYALGTNQERQYKVFYLGAKQEIVDKAVSNTAKLFPSFNVVGSHHGYFAENEENELVAQINKSGADILFVGTGFPKQEVFINKHKAQLAVPIKITVGGSFDVIAGVLKRAPLWMQKMGIEWFFRLLQEPSRITRMYLIPYELFQLYLYEKKHGK
ncbi:MAG: WecB/TagA/CpsF family glycosyltransferase [Candidatus Margulisbacteria bacterium]|nr:WecB/TagA/CpsF family glycosyltransferase [Candidatus Margulisiibacteriota bacterium]